MKEITSKEARDLYGLSQKETSRIIGVPLRIFRRYETNEKYGNTHKIKENRLLISSVELAKLTEKKGK